MKNLIKPIIFTLLFCISLFNCSDDDNSDDDGNNGDPSVSYAQFTVQGPITEGDYN